MNKFKVGLSFFLLTLLLGCQKSPESDIVANKNEDKLEKAIVQEANNQEKENVAQHKEDEFSVSTGDLQVVVDADVSAIDDKLSVVRVIPHEITSDDLMTWGELLFDGQTAYDPASPKSKGELEEEILLWKQRLNSTELEKEYGDEAAMVKESYEEIIANLEKLYEDAPENSEERETDYAFHPYEYYLTVVLCFCL